MGPKRSISIARSRRLEWLIVAAVGVCLILSLKAVPCIGAESPVRGGTLVLGSRMDVQTLNPLMFASVEERQADYNIFDSLWFIGVGGELIPNLAREIPARENGGISEDGLTYTFRLRKNAKWHDDAPFTAKDVKFTWETIMNPSFRAQNRTGHDRVAAMEIIDNYTLRVKLKERYGPFVNSWIETFIIPEHVLSSVKDLNTCEFNSKPVGTGPFKFQEWVRGDHLTFTANPSYHKGRPYIDRLIIKIIPDTTAFYLQFKAGDMDVVGLDGIPPSFYDESKKLENVKLYPCGTKLLEVIFLNQSKPLFKDKRVRQALYQSIDKRPIIEQVLYGIGKEAETYIPPFSWYRKPGLKGHQYNVENAKKLLDQAGWKPGKEGIREKDGMKFEFDFATTAGTKTREEYQQIIQQQWQQIGVKANIKNLASPMLWGEYYQKSQFDAILGSFNVPVDPEISLRFHSQSIPIETGKGANYMCFKNAEFDSLLEAGARETDPNKRKEIYWKIQELFVDELPTLPLYFRYFVFATKAKVQNFNPNGNADGVTTWNSREWWMKGK